MCKNFAGRSLCWFFLFFYENYILADNLLKQQSRKCIYIDWYVQSASIYLIPIAKYTLKINFNKKVYF